MTAFTRFLRYWLSLMKYSTLKVPHLRFAKDLIEILYMSAVIHIS